MGSGKEEEEDILAKEKRGEDSISIRLFKDYSVYLNPLLQGLARRGW